ncbi:MAG TPA: glycosyltransferase family 39 protein [Caldimonas sp.]|nr:glycosyltransferase family 39 protein [Caldimonas sp.]HEX4234095.1 glycosyltransferase family 39 protein [Caldimonas sp.]
MSTDDARPLSIAEPSAGARRGTRPRVLGALAVFAWLAFALGLHPLTVPDEGRYASVAWEMLRSADWIVPTENGLPFFHKPPLFYWLTALSMRAFGVGPAAARVAPLLAALAAMLGVHVVTRRRAGEAVADAAVVVTATLPFFFVAAQYANLDMLVAAFIALAVVFAADAALDLDRGAPHRKALALAWACAALGVLAKGLIGVVLPGLVLVVWLVASGRWRTIPRLLSPLGLAVFVLVAAPWFFAVQQRYPEFAHYFFIHQHFERFTETGFNNPQPWWFFFVVFPALTLPWSLWLARRPRRDGGDESADRRDWRRLMWIWLATIIVFFSLPQSKPAGYVMPALFPAGFLIAEPVLAAWRSTSAARRRIAAATLAASVSICLAAVAWAALVYDGDDTSIARALLASRAPGDPVAFVDEYFFDVPLLARLGEPVAVVADWKDPKIGERDNWRRELAEAARFAPERAAALLVDRGRGFALRCGKAPLWVVVKPQDEAPVAAQRDAVRVAATNRAALWRLAPQTCSGAPSSAAIAAMR